MFYAPLHSVAPSGNEDGEARWKAIGRVSGMIVFVVIHTSRERHQQGDWVEVIRLISARRATRQEQKRYEDQDG